MLPSQSMKSHIGNKLPRGKKFDDHEINQELPPGFHDILTMITREVMMHKPLNVYEFCATITEHELDKRILMELATPVKLGLEENKSNVITPTKEHIMVEEQQEEKATNLMMSKEELCESDMSKISRECYLTEDILKTTEIQKPEEREVHELFVEEDIIKQHIITGPFSSYSFLKETANMKENENFVTLTMQNEDIHSTEDVQQGDMDILETDLADRDVYMDQIIRNATFEENMPNNMKRSAIKDTLHNFETTKNVSDDNYSKHDNIENTSELDQEKLYDPVEESMPKNVMSCDKKLSQVCYAQQGLSGNENITETDSVSRSNPEQKYSDLNSCKHDGQNDIYFVAPMLNGDGEEFLITDTEKYDAVDSGNTCEREAVKNTESCTDESPSQNASISESDIRQTDLTNRYLDSVERATVLDKATVNTVVEKHTPNYAKDQEVIEPEIIDSQEHIFSNGTDEDSHSEIASISVFDFMDKQTDSSESNLDEETKYHITEECDDTDNDLDLNNDQSTKKDANFNTGCISESRFSHKQADLHTYEINLYEENVQRDEIEQHVFIDDQKDLDCTQNPIYDAIIASKCTREPNIGQKQADINSSESEDNIPVEYAVRIKHQYRKNHQSTGKDVVIESARFNQKQTQLNSSEPVLSEVSNQSDTTEYNIQQKNKISENTVEVTINENNQISENDSGENGAILVSASTANDDAVEGKMDNMNGTTNDDLKLSSDETGHMLSITKYSTDDSISEISCKSDFNDLEPDNERNECLDQTKPNADVEETISKAADHISEQYEFSTGQQNQINDEVPIELSGSMMKATQCGDAHILNDRISENNFRQNGTAFLSTSAENVNVEENMVNDTAYCDIKLYASYETEQDFSSTKHSTEDTVSDCEYISESEFREQQPELHNLESGNERTIYSDKTVSSDDQNFEQHKCSNIQQDQNTDKITTEDTIFESDSLSDSMMATTHCGDAGDVLNIQCNNDQQEMSNIASMMKYEVPSNEHYYRAITLYEEIVQYIEHVIAAAIEYIVAESQVADEEQSLEEKKSD